MTPGTRLRSLASRVCSAATMERLIDPVLADLQCELAEARRSGGRWHIRWTLIRGYLAFWRAIACHVPIRAGRAIRGGGITDAGSVGGGLTAAAVTMALLTALLIAPSLPGSWRRSDHLALFILLLVPQAIPISMPLALLAGVVRGLRNHRVTRRLTIVVLTIGLAASLTSLATMNWLVPAANQAFRVIASGRADIQPGPSETSLTALREQAFFKKAMGLDRQAGEMLLNYHLRWSVAGAALGFAVFGLGVIRLSAGRVVTAAIATFGPWLYVTYVFEMSNVESAVFADERLAIATAWLPTLAVIVIAAFLSAAARQAPTTDA